MKNISILMGDGRHGCHRLLEAVSEFVFGFGEG